MFTIIGGDGREYGPASADQLRTWIADGRANLDTKAKPIGATEWRRLGDLPEFLPAASVPPPLATEASADPAAVSAPTTFPPEVPVFDAGQSLAPEPEAELAGRGARTGAACINAFLYFLSMMPGGVLTGLRLLKEHPEIARGVPLRPDQIDLAALAPTVVWIYVGLAFVMLVQCIFLATRGQNIGKLIADVRVVSVLDDGPAGFLRAGVVRFVLPVVLIFLLNAFFLLGFVVLVVDYCFMFRADRRCLHDLIAGTRVVKA
jgi:uncharacterized RDD family membrane protein YckC